MDIIAELQDLQQKAMLFATETDREKRWAGAHYVEAQLRALDDQYDITRRGTEQERVELGACLAVLFDFCFYDKLEDSDWIEALPDHYDGDLDKLVQEMKR